MKFKSAKASALNDIMRYQHKRYATNELKYVVTASYLIDDLTATKLNRELGIHKVNKTKIHRNFKK